MTLEPAEVGNILVKKYEAAKCHYCGKSARYGVVVTTQHPTIYMGQLFYLTRYACKNCGANEGLVLTENP